MMMDRGDHHSHDEEGWATDHGCLEPWGEDQDGQVWVVCTRVTGHTSAHVAGYGTNVPGLGWAAAVWTEDGIELQPDHGGWHLAVAAYRAELAARDDELPR